ncbi:MAG: hypothetical protein LQ343_003996 [Gyalolechia ehrenbergii]|nr:MAG: hypothetical protein LQ343_003996 [Gyalolechia ehrenbergii]
MIFSNTGQVLTSLADLIVEGRQQPDTAAGEDPLQLFQEALGFFQRCLSLQEYQFTQFEADACASAPETMEFDELAGDTTTNNAPEPSQSNGEPSDDDTWAMIREPVTHSTLLDTLLAQVETLTSVCGLLSVQGDSDPSWVEQYSQHLLQDRIVVAVKETDRQHETGLTRAKFKCALADAGFGTSRVDLYVYEREIAAAYEHLTASGHDPQALCDRADAEVVFNASIERYLGQGIGILPEDSTRISVVRWKHLTKALDSLTAAGKLPGVKNLPRIQLRRGDCEMLRRRLGSAPSNYDIASKSEPTLLKNAEIYYRGAARLAKAEAATDEEGEALAKEAIAADILANPSRLPKRIAIHRLRSQEVFEDMIEEGLLLRHDIEKLGIEDLKKQA